MRMPIDGLLRIWVNSVMSALAWNLNDWLKDFFATWGVSTLDGACLK
jgi:hypothetical protein